MDALLWGVEDDPVLRNTISVIGLLDRAPDFERLTERFDRLSRIAPNFRHRLVSAPMRIDAPAWVVDPDFDLSFHVRRGAVAPPGTLPGLLEHAQTSVMAGLDKGRAMWQATVLDGLRGQKGSKAALFIKVHHVLTDGIGGLALMAHLLDSERDGDPLGPMPEPPAPMPVSARPLLTDALGRMQRRNLDTARMLIGGSAKAIPVVLRNPRRAARDAVGNARALGRMLLPPGSSESSLITARHGWNRFGVLEAKVSDLVGAARALDATVNDVYVAGVIGGVAAYHSAMGAPVANLKVCVPVNVRRKGDPIGGNRTSVVRASVPAEGASAAQRIAAVHRTVRAARDDLAYPLTSVFAPLLGAFGPMLAPFIGAMSKGFDLVVSNVPGGNDRAFVGGAALNRLYAFGPPSGTAINVTMHTYRGVGYMGVNADAAAVSDLDLLIRCLEDSFAEVAALG